MGSGHAHALDDLDDLDEYVRPEVRRAMWVAVGVCALLVLVGLVVLWPSGDDGTSTDPLGLDGDPVKATAESVTELLETVAGKLEELNARDADDPRAEHVVLLTAALPFAPQERNDSGREDTAPEAATS